MNCMFAFLLHIPSSTNQCSDVFGDGVACIHIHPMDFKIIYLDRNLFHYKVVKRVKPVSILVLRLNFLIDR